ncbi:hypothetical protein PR048_027229 [Dryococelus australis]|uniref:Uncharacterized protein n=1 Tax=Dryococelus australis TaxID=614101 RepID=A0ABQ9GG90_9NEOP|nr:hypothetical protein PR048_027229 [Dryococelus australis]
MKWEECKLVAIEPKILYMDSNSCSKEDLHSSAYYLFIASSRAFGMWLDIVCLFYITCATLSFLLFGQGNVQWVCTMLITIFEI